MNELLLTDKLLIIVNGLSRLINSLLQ